MHSLMQFSGQFARVAAGVVIGETPREFLWRLFVVASLLVYHWIGRRLRRCRIPGDVGGGDFRSRSLLQLWWVTPTIPEAVGAREPAYDIATWIPRSFKMWISALLDTTGQYLEVVIIGLILGPAAAGVYFVATRITNVFAMITGGIAVYATSQISALFYSSAKVELQSMLRALAIIGAILNGAALLVIILAGKLLLWAFGSIYVAAYPALIVLAIGASIGALVGPAAHVLLLTGHEGTYPRIMAAVLFVPDRADRGPGAELRPDGRGGRLEHLGGDHDACADHRMSPAGRPRSIPRLHALRTEPRAVRLKERAP